MNFSAASSSSLVVTPGRTLRGEHLHAGGVDRPRGRHRLELLLGLGDDPSAIHRQILLYISISSSRRNVASRPRMCSATSSGGAVPSTALKDVVVVVPLDQRLRLLMVGRQALLDHLGLVVVADHQLAAVDVADALLLRGVELEVEDVAALLAGPPAAEPPDDLLVGDVDHQRGAHLAAELADLLAERLGLRDRPREAVEDEPVAGLRLLDPLRDHGDDQLVGDQVAGVHVLLRLGAELGPLLHRRSAGCRPSRSRAAAGPPAGARPGSPCRSPGGRGG